MQYFKTSYVFNTNEFVCMCGISETLTQLTLNLPTSTITRFNV